jgi:hypothetical protein
MVDPCRVGPISFDPDDREPMMGDQMSGDGSASLIEFTRSMARLAQQHDAPFREAIEQRPESRVAEVRKRFSGHCDHLRE